MSTLKVDTVRPVTTDGSLSLKGDSGGSATANGISVDSSGNTSVSGSTSLDGAVTINDSGADVDFRVESDTVDHALFVQGSDGYVGIGVSSPADKLHVDGNIRLTSGSGINFSAYATTGNPSSNLLDDYEEGTWTATYGTSGSDSGTYTKIGRLVTIHVTLKDSGQTFSTISGAPFSSAGDPQAGCFGRIAGFFGFDRSNIGVAITGTTITIYNATSVNQAVTSAGTTRLDITITYEI